jgi:hypothetical protein
MTSEQQVFFCDDLRRHILSFLRQKPKISCANCQCVCVWDKKVKEHIQVYPFMDSDNRYYCTSCLGEYYANLNMGCIIN